MSLALMLAAIAVVAAAAGYLGAAAAAGAGPVQPPNRRSSHEVPTPLCGGLGVVAGVGAGAALAALAGLAGYFDGAAARGLVGLAGVLAVCGAAAALGVLDDLFELPAAPKFIVLAAVGVGIAIAAGPARELPAFAGLALSLPYGLALAGSALWVFTLINAVNFMDGANGLAGGTGAVAAAALCASAAVSGALEAAVAAAALAGALAGFAPWNAQARAHVFMGDAGALFVGALYGGASLLYVSAAPSGALYAAALPMAALLADVLLTLVLRARLKRPLHLAHRDHAYQRLIAAGASHLSVSRRLWARTAVLGALAVAAAAFAKPAFALVALIFGAGAASLWWFADRARAAAGAGGERSSSARP